MNTVKKSVAVGLLALLTVGAYSLLTGKEVNDISTDSPHSSIQLASSSTYLMVKDYLASSMAYNQDTREFLMTSDHPHTLFAEPISTLMVLADDLVTVKQTLDIPSDSDLEGLAYVGNNMAIAISEKGTIYRLKNDGEKWSLLDSKKGLIGQVTKVASLATDVEADKLYTAEKEGKKNLYIMDMQGQLERTIELKFDNPAGAYSLESDFTIAGLTYHNGYLYMLSEAYSTVFKFDLKTEKIIQAYGLSDSHEMGGLTFRDGHFVTAGDAESYLPDPVISEFKL
ncbi:hypothetical protein [Aliivibrio kagoshimensis]|uniref:hypothetical protein n=1 Tax=Aliivibrio kagoshimensis TaxID=2910230 RepID=UPI003D14A4C2